MSEWRDSRTNKPPKKYRFWGYDVFYGQIEVCVWDGKLNSDGYPVPRSLMQNGDDYYFRYWCPLVVPDSPTDEQLIKG